MLLQNKYLIGGVTFLFIGVMAMFPVNIAVALDDISPVIRLVAVSSIILIAASAVLFVADASYHRRLKKERP